MPDLTGLLHSQVGYDLGCPMRAVIRSTRPDYVPEGSTLEVREAGSGALALQGSVARWGDIWKSTWWIADFSALSESGEYRLAVLHQGSEVCSSDAFRVGPSVLWDETVRPVALEQLEERARVARNGSGWKDSGGAWREVNGHATTLIGLTDLLDLAHYAFSPDEVRRLVAQIVNGCDYLATCQDKAEDLGLGEGAMVHEIPHFLQVIPADLAQSTVALARASRFVYEHDRARANDYLRRAEKAFMQWIAGLHAGITRESLEGCFYWKPETLPA